jgi:hypothetical protein
MRHGKGRYRWEDQSGYEGEWFEDKMHGYGAFVTVEGEII